MFITIDEILQNSQKEAKEVKKNSLWGTAVVFLVCKSYTRKREVDKNTSGGESETLVENVV